MAQCRVCGSKLEGSPRFCPSCGSEVQAATPQPAPEKQAEPKTRRVARVLIPVILIGGLAIFYLYINPSVHPIIQKQPVVATPPDNDTGWVTSSPVAIRYEDDFVAFPLEEVKRHRLVRFEYAARTTTRPVLAYLATDGRLVTAISVSEHCGSTDFKLKGHHIYCARCPSHWDMMTMEAYACCAKYYPDPIPSRVEGDEVRISRQALENWAGRL